MTAKPIFVATHPRACSTAFERVFMQCRDKLQTVHEPFGDAFYYGPERMSSRFESNPKEREESGFSESTYASIFENIARGHEQGKRVFIKDITYYLVPPFAQKSQVAPSLQHIDRRICDTDRNASETADDASETASGSRTPQDSAVSVHGSPTKEKASIPTSAAGAPFPYKTHSEPQNPTVMPRELLERFHFTFLIRHPRSSVPSYYRCCVPPLVERTKFDFMPSESGYDELRALFDYCRSTGLVGPNVCSGDGKPSKEGAVDICVIDADDLLDDPEGILRKYCASIGMEFSPSMLKWDEESREFARKEFSKWDGFHDDAIEAMDLKPRAHKHAPKSDEQLYKEWVQTYGQEAADIMKKTVADNVETYEYLKQFAIKA